MELKVNTFTLGTEREAALKPLEEASEAREAWQMLNHTRESGNPIVAVMWGKYLDDLANELADCITACCNLAERYGIDLQAALDRVERHNRERGRYE